MDLSDLAPIPLVAPPHVAHELKLARASAIKVMEAGLCGTVFSDGQRLLVHADELDRLAKTDFLDEADAPPGLIVRVGPAQPDDTDERKFLGWHAAAAPEDRRAGISRWWPAAAATDLIGQVLVATIAGFVVEVATIDDVTEHGGRYSFTLIETDSQAEHSYRGKRLPTIGGGVTLRIT